MTVAHLLLSDHRARTAPHEAVVRIAGVMGGRPVIRGTRITVASVKGRIAGGDSIEDLLLDYPDVPRAAFEAAAAHDTEREPAAAGPARPAV